MELSSSPFNEVYHHNDSQDIKERQRRFAQLMHEHGTMDPEDIKQLAYQYMPQPPKKPKTRSELTQRAASIPDLRMHADIERHHVFGNKPPPSSRHLDKRFTSFNEDIIKTKVPLQPISRPGSAELDHLSTSMSYWNQQQRLSEAHSMSSHRHSPSDIEAFKRKSAIVRPWEIEEQSSREGASSPFRAHHAPVNSPHPPMQTLSTSNQHHHKKQQQPHAEKPYIHLSASNKYKADIIHFAKQNSPALPMSGDSVRSATKFRYDDVLSNEHERTKNRARLASDQSLSPTFPMPAGGSTGVIAARQLPPPSSTMTRTRSDSEETVSADEVDENKLSINNSASHPIVQRGPAPVQSKHLECPADLLKQKSFGHHQQNLSPHLPPSSSATSIASPQQHAQHLMLSQQQQQHARLESTLSPQHLEERYTTSRLSSREFYCQQQLDEEIKKQQQILFHRQQRAVVEEEERYARHEEEFRLLHLQQKREVVAGHPLSAPLPSQYQMHLDAIAAAEEEEQLNKRRQINFFMQQKEQPKLLKIQQDEVLKQLHAAHPEEAYQMRLLQEDNRRRLAMASAAVEKEQILMKQHQLQRQQQLAEDEMRARGEQLVQQYKPLEEQQHLMRATGQHLVVTSSAEYSSHQARRVKQNSGGEYLKVNSALLQQQQQQKEEKHPRTASPSRHHLHQHHRNFSVESVNTTPDVLSGNSRVQSPLQPPNQEFLQQQLEEVARLGISHQSSIDMRRFSPKPSNTHTANNPAANHAAQSTKTVHTVLATIPQQKKVVSKEAPVVKVRSLRVADIERLDQTLSIRQGEAEMQSSPQQQQSTLHRPLTPDLQQQQKSQYLQRQQLEEQLRQQQQLQEEEQLQHQQQLQQEREKLIQQQKEHQQLQHQQQLQRHQLEHQHLEKERKSKDDLKGIKQLEKSQKQAITLSQQNIHSEASKQHYSKAMKSTPRGSETQLVTSPVEKLYAPIHCTDTAKSGESPLTPKQLPTKHYDAVPQRIVKSSAPRGILKGILQEVPTKESIAVTSAEKMKVITSTEEEQTISKSNSEDASKREETTNKVTASMEKEKKEKVTIRAESPDIYDMSLNDDDDDDNDEQHLDLYSNISTTSQKGNIPDTHVDLFYDTTNTTTVADSDQVPVCDDVNKETTNDKPRESNATSVNQDGGTLTSKQSISKNKQEPIVNVTADDENKSSPETKETDPVPPKERPGTPLLDEPVTEKISSSTNVSASVVVQSKPIPASLKLSLDKEGEKTAPPGSPGSTPEAHTPLMDEPVAFNFPPPDPAVVVDSLSGDYLRFQSHTVAASASFNIAVSSSSAPPPAGYLQQQRPATVEAFESITPPSSPEHSSSTSKSGDASAVQQHQNQFEAVALSPALNNSVAAFPFSAFNINVAGRSRSSSRSGSVSQSPGPSFNDQSPKSDFENSGAVSGSSAKSSKAKSNKRKRGGVESPDSKRNQKQSYRKSGSSGSNISKSPESSGR